MNGLVQHSRVPDKDENGVSLAMQRITLMGPKYVDRITHNAVNMRFTAYTPYDQE